MLRAAGSREVTTSDLGQLSQLSALFAEPCTTRQLYWSRQRNHPPFCHMQVLAGSASFLLPSMLMGAVGGVCALANIAPQPLLELISAYKAGDIEKASELQLRMIAPNNVCFVTCVGKHRLVLTLMKKKVEPKGHVVCCSILETRNGTHIRSSLISVF